MKESLSTTLIVHCYNAAIWLYPIQFREGYGPVMQQTLQDALADPEFPRSALVPTLVVDLAQSLIKENIAMMADTFARPALLFNALVLAALSTILALAMYAIPQQVLRQGAYDPQVELAGNAAIQLANGTTAAEVVPSAGSLSKVDIAQSLSNFTIAFDERGIVLASSAILDGSTPIPPVGVLDFTRLHGEDRITWQPRRGVRIAAIVKHVPGAQGGFVLTGRNMREVEDRIDQIGNMAQFLWLGMLGIVLGGTFLFGWLTRTPKTATV